MVCFSCFSFASNYPRLLITRTPYFENNFFNSINHNFKWYSDEILDIDKIISFLENNIPVLVISETGYLNFMELREGEMLLDIRLQFSVLI